MIFSFYVIAEDVAAETGEKLLRLREEGLLSLEGAGGAAEIIELVENNVHVSYHEQRSCGLETRRIYIGR